MRKGEVWRVDFGVSRGHVQSGQRPAIVLQNNRFNQLLPTSLVIPLTSTLSTQRFPGTLFVQPDANNGRSNPSVALVFQSQVVDQSMFVQYLGDIETNTMQAIEALLVSLIS